MLQKIGLAPAPDFPDPAAAPVALLDQVLREQAELNDRLILLCGRLTDMADIAMGPAPDGPAGHKVPNVATAAPNNGKAGSILDCLSLARVLAIAIDDQIGRLAQLTGRP